MKVCRSNVKAMSHIHQSKNESCSQMKLVSFSACLRCTYHWLSSLNQKRFKSIRWLFRLLPYIFRLDMRKRCWKLWEISEIFDIFQCNVTRVTWVNWKLREVENYTKQHIAIVSFDQSHSCFGYLLDISRWANGFIWRLSLFSEGFKI